MERLPATLGAVPLPPSAPANAMRRMASPVVALGMVNFYRRPSKKEAELAEGKTQAGLWWNRGGARDYLRVQICPSVLIQRSPSSVVSSKIGGCADGAAERLASAGGALSPPTLLAKRC